MEDLEQGELYQSFKENILYALNKAKNESIRITFIFSGTCQGTKFLSREHITYFAGDFIYKNVHLDEDLVDRDIIINIILDNFSYDCFSYIGCKEKTCGVNYHGFIDCWAEDRFTFNYKRMNCDCAEEEV